MPRRASPTPRGGMFRVLAWWVTAKVEWREGSGSMSRVTVADLQRRTETLIADAERMLQSDNKNLPVGLPTAVRGLHYLRELIASGNLNGEILKKQAFGIFRLVSDEGTFEESDIGKELLQLSTAMREVDLTSS